MIELKSFGIWTFDFDRQPFAEVRNAVAEIDALGYGSIWVPEAMGREALTQAALLLAASERVVVANGIARIGVRDARTMVAAQQSLAEVYPGRHLLGLGASDRVEGGVGAVAAMRAYLDAMDAATYLPPPPKVQPLRALAALGPSMLRLAAERTAGAHTYLVTPDHTAFARHHLGPEPLLAAEQAVVLDSDSEVARVTARQHLAPYLELPAYRANFGRLGFDDDDLANGGSNRLIDAIVAWGGVDAVAQHLKAHLDAGANHVGIQVLSSTGRLPIEEWRMLAQVLL